MRIIKFYTDCVITSGIKRAVITDLTREHYKLIPLAMAEIIIAFDGKEEAELWRAFEGQEEMLAVYLEFLYENEFIFWCDTMEEAMRFTALNTQWDYPGQISNAVLELNHTSNYNIGHVLSSLQQLGCQSVKIMIDDPKEQEAILLSILKLLEGSLITCLEVNLSFSEGLEAKLLKWMIQFPRLLKVFVFCAPENVISEAVKEQLWKHSKIIFTTAPMSNNSCGQVHWGYFTTNIIHYTESLLHNTCLNRKLAIDSGGNIKNCQGMKEHFGNLKDTTLSVAINTQGFKKYWTY
jgi:SPASM domain peptide maturase of grasp-with-spasm system